MKNIAIVMAAMALSISAYGAGFRTEGTKLLDANGQEFVMRGVNYSWTWQRGHEYSVIPAAKRLGSNTIRIQLNDTGSSKCSAADMERLIKICEEQKLVVMFNTHDETGKDDLAGLERARDFWIEMKPVLDKYPDVLVNISNEWCGSWDADKWAAGYMKVIPELRKARIKNTLVVDCAGFGQYAQSIISRGADVLASDPDRNLVFSMHVYDTLGSSAAKVRFNIDKCLEVGAPVIVGEFSYEHVGKPVAYKTVMKHCAEKNVGWLIWSWTGNDGSTKACDMFKTYDETHMLANGNACVNHEFGLKATGKQCSIYGTELPGREYNTVTVTPEAPIVFKSDFSTDYQFEARHFPNVRVGDKIRFHYTCEKPGAGEKEAFLMQVVYKQAVTWKWTQQNVTLDPAKAYYDHEVSDIDFRDGLIWDGLHLKGQNFTLSKIEILPTGHDVTFEPEDVPAREPESDPDFEKEVTESDLIATIWDKETSFGKNWSSSDITIPESKFADAKEGDIIRLITTGSGQLQLAVKDADWKWIQLCKFYELAGENWDEQIADNEFAKISARQYLDYLKLHGLIVKGSDFTLKSVELRRPRTGGVESIGGTAGSGIDFSVPYEIYDLQGMRVPKMKQGEIYIVRQNGQSMKIRR